MTTKQGIFKIAATNATGFTDSRSNDWLFHTVDPLQSILMGTQYNSISTMNIASDIITFNKPLVIRNTVSSAQSNFALKVDNHILPSSHLTIDIGSSNMRFRDLYISGNSLHMGSNVISSDYVSGGVKMLDCNLNLVRLVVRDIQIGTGTSTNIITTDSNGSLTVVQLDSNNAPSSNPTTQTVSQGTFSNIATSNMQVININTVTLSNFAFACSNAYINTLSNGVFACSNSYIQNAYVNTMQTSSSFCSNVYANTMSNSVLASSNATLTTAVIATGFATTLNNSVFASSNSFITNAYVVTMSNSVFSSSNSFIGTASISQILACSNAYVNTMSAAALTCSNAYVSGFIGVSNLVPTYPIHVNSSVGGISIYTNADVASFSDIRKKRDLKRIDSALDKIDKINGYTFERYTGMTGMTGMTGTTEPSANEVDRKRYAGLIAQEVQAVLPEVVGTDADGYLNIAYGNVVALLVNAIQELRAEVKGLRQRNV